MGFREVSGMLKARWPTEKAVPAKRLAVPGILCFCTLFAAFGVLETSAAVYPHDSARPDYCLNCHTEEIYAGDCDEVSGFCLVADSVDGLCLICHVKEECCPVGQEHQSKLYIGKITHPSDLKTSDLDPVYLPRTLPVHKGSITCRTCHLHTRTGDSDYKMLRIVEKSQTGVDWSPLCADCHENK